DPAVGRAHGGARPRRGGPGHRHPPADARGWDPDAHRARHGRGLRRGRPGDRGRRRRRARDRQPRGGPFQPRGAGGVHEAGDTVSDSILQLAGVHTYYGPSHVLRGVDLTVGHDEVVAVLGRNGMGKTTLIHTIAGLVKPREGTIALEGERIDGLAPWRIARRGLSLLPQGHRVFPSLTVAENL